MTPCVAFPLLFASRSSFSSVGTPRTHSKHALPAALHIHTQTVTPTTAFASTPSTADLTQPLRWSSSAGDACGVRRTRERDDGEPEYVQPSFLCWLYTMYAYVPAATDHNALRIAGYTRVPQSSRSGGVHDPISPRRRSRDPHCRADQPQRGRPEPSKPRDKSQHPLHRGHGVPHPDHLLLQQFQRQRRGLSWPRARPSRLDGVP